MEWVCGGDNFGDGDTGSLLCVYFVRSLLCSQCVGDRAWQKPGSVVADSMVMCLVRDRWRGRKCIQEPRWLPKKCWCLYEFGSSQHRACLVPDQWHCGSVPTDSKVDQTLAVLGRQLAHQEVTNILLCHLLPKVSASGPAASELPVAQERFHGHPLVLLIRYFPKKAFCSAKCTRSVPPFPFRISTVDTKNLICQTCSTAERRHTVIKN